MKNEFTLQDTKSWPRNVRSFLDVKAPFYKDLFFAQHGYEESAALGGRYDQFQGEFEAILESYSLRVFHCTRLTAEEIADVQANGVVPLSPTFLEMRIRQLGLRDDVTELLLRENRVYERFRQNMIWFCLFPPEQQSYGVQRFFRSWGGESLYADHERHPISGPILRNIGIPCIIELIIPIKMMRHRIFVLTMPKNYFGAEKGVIRGEDHSTDPLLPSRIVKIHKFPTFSFEKLSGWSRHKDDLPPNRM